MRVGVTQSKWKPLRMLAAAAVALLSLSSLPIFAGVATAWETPAQGATAKSITVSGAVRNAGGEPISGADVYLDSKREAALAHAVSSDDGSFKLTVDHGGTYTVRAEKSGWTGDQSDPIELPRDATKRVDLVMENSRNPSANSDGNTAAAPGNSATAGNSAKAGNGTSGKERQLLISVRRKKQATSARREPGKRNDHSGCPRFAKLTWDPLRSQSRAKLNDPCLY